MGYLTADQELKRNGSGYYDPTAYKALRNIEREVERMDCKRGEIFEFTTARGDLRKVLIISDDARRYSRNLTGILLNEESKGEYGVQILCGCLMYAECDRISHIKADAIGNYIRTATDEEMQNIDETIMDALGLKVENEAAIPDSKLEKELAEARAKIMELETRQTYSPEQVDAISRQANEAIRLKAERDVYKELYEKLLERMGA